MGEVMYDSGSVPDESLFSPRETSPNLMTLKSLDFSCVSGREST